MFNFNSSIFQESPPFETDLRQIVTKVNREGQSILVDTETCNLATYGYALPAIIGVSRQMLIAGKLDLSHQEKQWQNGAFSLANEAVKTYLREAVRRRVYSNQFEDLVGQQKKWPLNKHSILIIQYNHKLFKPYRSGKLQQSYSLSD